MFKRLAFAALAATLAGALRPAPAVAQKALVYCPVAIDGTGCNRIVDALSSRFPEGVDRGYDGSNGTVDLHKADLQHYSVVVVPSLADNDNSKPYALLRDVATRFKMAINGRVAIYAGAPDQGGTNREAKNSLITNLANWASGGHKYKTGLVGLVAFLDLSSDATSRYDWVRAMSPAEVSADADLDTFGDVQSTGDASSSLLMTGNSSIKYSNMASLGLHVGKQGAAHMREAASAGTATNRKVVLIKYSLTPEASTDGPSFSRAKVGGASFSVSSTDASAATTTGPTLTTDRPDYQPGDTVLFTGTGFAPNDTVVITLHEDPAWIDPDRTVTAVADASGNFTNHTFVVDQHDFGVTFTATAVGSPSGLTTQMTFTDGNATSVSGTVTDASTSLPLSGVTVSCTTATGCNANISTTTDAAGSYVFSNGNKLSFGGNGPADLGLSFSKAGYANGTLTLAAVNNGDSFTGKNIALTPSGPTKLAFTTAPLTGVVGACIGPISVQTQSNSGVATNVASATTVNLLTNAASATAAFFLTNVCSGPITSVSIASGTNSASVYYKATARGTGTHTLTASATGLTQATQDETINKASPALSNLTAPLTITYGAATVALGGTIAAPGSTIPTGNVSVTLNGVTQLAAITAGTGSFTSSFDTSVLPASTTAYAVSYSFAADNDFNSVSDNASTTVTVNKATATLTLDATTLNQVYNGTPRIVTATTVPAGLTTVAVTYAGNSTAPTDAGSYAIVASLTNANYQATNATGTLTVAKAAPTFSNLSATPITYSTNANATATVSGTLKVGTALPATGTMAVSIAGTGGALTGSSAIDPSGNFSISVTVGALPGNATGYDITLTYAETPNFEAATDKSLKLVVNQATQSITFPTITDKTFGDPAVTLAATASSGLSVSYSTSGNCTASGSTLTLGNAGTCTVTASQAGDGNYLPAAPVPQTFNIKKADQTITFAALPDKTFGDPDFTVSATASSGLSVSFVAADNCSVSGTTVHITGAGSCTITAKQAGDNNYNAATDVPRTFTITKKTVVVTLSNLMTTYDANPKTVTASTTDPAGLKINITYNGSSTSPTNAGDYTVVATVDEANYQGTASGTLKIDKANQTITWTDPAAITYGTLLSSTQLNAAVQGVSGGTPPGALTYNPAAGTLLNAGVHTLNVSAAETNNYKPASKSASLTVNPAVATVTFTAASFTCTFAPATACPASATATGLGGGTSDPAGTVSIVYSGTANDGTTLTNSPTAPSKAGSYSATATYVPAAVDNYKAPAAVNATVTINRATPTFTFSALGNKTFGDASFSVSGNVFTNSDGSVSFGLGAGSVGCTVSVTGQVTITAGSGAGKCAIAASVSQGSNYLPAGPQTQSFTIAPFQPTIEWSNPANVLQGTLLSSTQLNAVVKGVGGSDITTTGGSLTYNPDANTPLVVVGSNPLSASFTPSNPANYMSAGPKTVYVNVVNVPPTVAAIVAPTDPVPMSTAVSISTSFTDPGGSTDAPYSIVVDWGKDPVTGTVLPTSTLSPMSAPGSITASHSYTAAGIYTIKVTVTDKNGGSGSSTTTNYVVVYDPNGGFVTGGGWINSLSGACLDTTICQDATGKANFGFVAKYQNGANKPPTGSTEFQFQAGNINFKSTDYQWLTIAGARAQFKGTGTINGSGTYQFLLTAIDGSITGGGGTDKFRIKIMNADGTAIIYDNQVTGDTSDSATPSTSLGGGSISIKSK